MPKTKISEFSATPANNTDIDSINIAEGCAPSGINDAIRELMAQLKDFQTGAVGDSFNGPVGSTTAGTGAFTTLSASSTTTLSGLTASTALALDASKNVVSVTNTGTGSNVLATSPTLVTPALGTPSSGVVTNLTGTASININGTVGATTASTGAFTTLAASGAVTLSGGTANGVAYLNGSKVLTTGSALTFNGTTLSNTTGFGGVSFTAYSSGETSERTTYSAAAGLQLASYQSVSGSPYTKTADIVANADGTAPSLMRFWVKASGSSSPAEAMRLTSTGLGIGTTTPDANLTVNGAASFAAGTALLPSIARAGDLNTGIWFPAADTIAASTGGTERLRLDSSGNLGIGTSSPSELLTVGAGTTSVNTVAYLNGGSADAKGAGIKLAKAGTAFGFIGAASWMEGATSNDLAFSANSAATIGMRLTSSGNLGIGTSSPSASAILDAQSTTKGVRMPNMTTTQKNAIASPAAGLMVFDTTLAKLCVYSGSAWQTITSV